MREKLAKWIAWKLSRQIVKWCFYRVCAFATSGKYGKDTPCGMTWETIIDRWEGKST